MSKGPLVLISSFAVAFALTCGQPKSDTGSSGTDTSTDTGRAPAPAPPPSIAASFTPPANNCEKGEATLAKAAPVVCVSVVDNRIVVTPESIEAFDRDPADKGKKTPVKIHWITRGNGRDLRILMKDPNQGCLAPPKCNGHGACMAETKDVTGKTQCKYGVFLDGVEVDPDVVITDCC